MADQFIGEVRIFGGNFAPKGWALCNGQLLPISQNTALFSLLGTYYGGDGKTNFALPNLMGRAPMHPGQGPGLTNRVLGEMDGSNTVTLLANEMPAHNHLPMANGNEDSGTMSVATGNVWGAGGRGTAIYSGDSSRVQMSMLALGPAGGSMPHNNMQPYLGVTYIIALEGIYPARP